MAPIQPRVTCVLVGRERRRLEPPRVLRRAVEAPRRLVLLPLAALGGRGRPPEDVGASTGGRGPQRDRGADGLLEDATRVAARDHDGGREAERVLQALGRRDVAARERRALEEQPRAERLHAEHADAPLDEDGQHAALEAVVVRVHDVEGHLDRVEVKVVRARRLQHVQVDLRALVAREPDEAQLPRVARGHERLDGAARREAALGVVHADDLVNLHEIDDVGAQRAQ